MKRVCRIHKTLIENRVWGITFLLLAWTAIVLLNGCDKSSEMEINQQSAQSVNQAQRLMRATEEKLPMTPSEIDAGRGAGSRIVKRIYDQAEIADGQSFADQLDKLLQDYTRQNLADPQVLKQYCNQLLRINDAYQAQEQRLNQVADEINRKRLDDAGKMLNLAISNAGNGEDAVAPQMMLGTIELARARRIRNQLLSQENHIKDLMSELNPWVMNMSREITAIYTLESSRPDESISMLNVELESFQEELKLAENSLQILLKEKGEVEEELNTVSSIAHELHQKYLNLLEQADKAQGEERLKLHQQAYVLRRGDEETRTSGGIEYEVQTELVLNKLNVLNNRIAFQQLRCRRLRQSIEVTQQALEKLKTNSRINEGVDTGVAQIRSITNNLIAVLKEHLDTIIQQESLYHNLRVDAMDAYRKAQEAFSNASRSPLKRQVSNYTQDMIEKVIIPEMASLWKIDIMHYESMVEMLELIQNLPDDDIRRNVDALAGPMIDDFNKMALEAQTSCDELIPEPEPESEEIEPGMPAEEPLADESIPDETMSFEPAEEEELPAESVPNPFE
ncbi:MAG: hypothetical protein JW860_11240 [Sedimentisphaerales bacterium]|nr:hypothetical protein [Sedimentisphaerales bacterium]